MDLLFVAPENIPDTQEWLKAHRLETQVSVYSATMLNEVQRIASMKKPLIGCCTLPFRAMDQNE